MRVFTMSHVSFASILLCLIMSPGCFCILPVLDGEVNVGLEGVGFDNVFIQDNTLPEVDTTVVPSGLGTGVVDPNLGTDGLNFGFTDDATLNGVGTNLVAPEFGLGDSNPNLGTADLSTGEVVDDGTALVLGGGNELGSLFQTVVGQVQTVLPAPSPSSVPSPAPPVTPVAQSPPAAAAAVPPASPSSSPPAQVATYKIPTCTTTQILFNGVCIECNTRIRGCNACQYDNGVLRCSQCAPGTTLDQPTRLVCIPCRVIWGCIECTDANTSGSSSPPFRPRDITCTLCRGSRPPRRKRCGKPMKKP